MSDLEKTYNELLSKIENADMEYRPSQQEKLKMYAFFKQINEGDVSGSKPGMTQFVARAKYIAWERLNGMSKDECMQSYIDLFSDKK